MKSFGAMFVCAAAMMLAAGCAVGPATPPGVLTPPEPVAELEARIRAEPHNLELYRQASELYLREGSTTAAREVATECTTRNPSEPNAWLLSANVSRTLLDLIAAHTALKQAYKLGGDMKTVAASREALTSFCEETWLWREAAVLREAAIQQAADAVTAAMSSDKPTGTIAIARYDDERAKRERASWEVGGLSRLVSSRRMEAPDDGTSLKWLNWLRTEMHGGFVDSACVQVVGTPSDAKPHGWLKNAGVQTVTLSMLVDSALRLIPLVTGHEQYTALSAFLNAALLKTEASQTRFAAYLGLWEIGWMREIGKAVPGVPASDTELAAKLDQIDSAHPDWVLRRALASALARGSDGSAADATKKLTELGLPPAMQPPLPKTPAEFRDLLIVLDAEAIGAARQMADAVNRLIAIYPSSMFLDLAAGRAEMAMYHFECVLLLTEPYAPVATAAPGTPTAAPPWPELRATMLQLRWKALIRADKAKQALEEIQTEGASKTPAQMSPKTAAWLKAVAELHVAEAVR